jgi:mono/diheme cytochrome c family protein
MKRDGLLMVLLFCGAIVVTAEQDGQRSVRDGVYTDAQATRGEKVYGVECAACHGADLAGMTPFPPLTGTAWAGNWNGHTLDAIVDRLEKTMPPDNPKTVTREQQVDVLAYLLKMNTYPAGSSELPHGAEQLKAITFEPKAKPGSKDPGLRTQLPGDGVLLPARRRGR